MRSVLVTGGAGYIGSHIVLDLIAAGHSPVVLDDLRSGTLAVVPQGVPFVKADIADQATVAETIRRYGVTDLIHCAAYLSVEESVRDPLSYWWIDVSSRSGVKRMVFSSTAAVYGNCMVMPVSENQLPAPISPYGTTKRAVETLMADVCRASGMVSVALRYFNVAGADPAGRTGPGPAAQLSLIRAACLAALGVRDGISIFGQDYDTRDGTAVRDYIHVCDLASVHTVVLNGLEAEAPGTALTLNCGYGTGFTVREVVDTTMAVAGVSFPVREAPRRAGDIGVMVADTGQLRNRYQWTPRHADLGKIIADTLAWERKTHQGKEPHRPDL
jgi:UDP-glucose 4-epimerase